MYCSDIDKLTTVFRPDITVMVGRALRINYLSIYLSGQVSLFLSGPVSLCVLIYNNFV